MPVRRQNLTTVRVRTKDGGYLKGEGSIDGGNKSQHGFDNGMWERKRLAQEKIEAYREQKL